MDEKLVLGMPDAQAAIAPMRKYETTEKRENRKHFLFPFFFLGMLGAMFGKADTEQNPQSADEEAPADAPQPDIDVVEDVAAFLRTVSSEPFFRSYGAPLATVRLSFQTQRLDHDRLDGVGERTIRAGMANDNHRSVVDRNDNFEFPPLATPGRPTASDPASRPDQYWPDEDEDEDDGDSGDDDTDDGQDDDEVTPTDPGDDDEPGENPGDGDEDEDDNDNDPNRSPVSLGRNVLSSGLMNLSALVLLDDLLHLVRDPDGDLLSITDITVSSGSIRVYDDDIWLYTPERGYLGEVTFSYGVTDGADEIEAESVLHLLKPQPREILGTEGDDILLGTPQADIIAGLGGNDIIYAREDRDIVFGGDGDDRILGGAGDDILYGEAGHDYMAGGDGDDILFGGDGNDQLFGEAGNDVLVAGLGNDFLSGGDGDDRLFAEEGDDLLQGDAGNDLLDGGTGSDVLVGGTGQDVVGGGDGDDVIRTGFDEELRNDPTPTDDGNDVYSGGEGFDTLDASAAIQSIVVDLSTGTASGEEIGVDQVASIEAVIGGAGDDTITGDAEANTLDGGAGDDTIAAGGGNDKVLSGAGDDSYSGGTGFDTFDASASEESIEVDLSAGTASGEEIGTDLLASIEAVIGGAGDDTITGDAEANRLDGGAGDDTIAAGGGDDTLVSGAGDDSYSGGAGFDTFDASASKESIEVDLTAGTAGGEEIGTDELDSIEAVIGGAGDDAITGDAVANTIEGGAGDDLISSLDGNDTVSGGAGNDIIIVVARDSNDQNGHDGDDDYSGDDGFDTLDLSALLQGVIADLEAEFAEGEEIGRDRVAGFEAIVGGHSSDRLRGNSKDNLLIGGDGSDKLSGRDGDDILAGGDGDDQVSGDGGNDTILVALQVSRIGREGTDDGDDSYSGGDGCDTYDASAAINAVVINLACGTASGEDIGEDTLDSFEKAVGGAGADLIIASNAVNLLTGGAGNDIFVFRSLAAILNDGQGRDAISDFSIGDRIDFSQIAASIGGLSFASFADVEGGRQGSYVSLHHQTFDDGERTIVRAIIDFERDEDIEILLYGRHELTEQDFILAALECPSPDPVDRA